MAAEEIIENLHTPLGRDKHLRLRSATTEELILRLQKASASAINTLVEVMKNGTMEENRIKAAQSILNIASRIKLSDGLPQDLGSSHWLPAIRDKQQLNLSVEYFLKVNPDASDRAIAASLGVDEEQICDIRHKILAIEQ